jgi:hypothetical protein
MKLSIALLLGALLLVSAQDFPDEPIEHEYVNHIQWFSEYSDDCLEFCHHKCLHEKAPPIHVGCMVGCVENRQTVKEHACVPSTANKVAHISFLAAAAASKGKGKRSVGKPFFGSE